MESVQTFDHFKDRQREREGGGERKRNRKRPILDEQEARRIFMGVPYAESPLKTDRSTHLVEVAIVMSRRLSPII